MSEQKKMRQALENTQGLLSKAVIGDDVNMAATLRLLLEIREALAARAGEVLTDEYVDDLLKARIPGGSSALVWFTHYDDDRVLPNIRDVVRAVIAAHEAKCGAAA